MDGAVDASVDGAMEAAVDASVDGPARDAVMAPSRVPRAIAAGDTFACATLEDGTVRCWGDDREGQLGDGRRVREAQGVVMVIATPGAAATNPLQSVVRVVAGSSAACALLGDGSLRCWGSNEAGALGNGTTSVQSGPVPVTW